MSREWNNVGENWLWFEVCGPIGWSCRTRLAFQRWWKGESTRMMHFNQTVFFLAKNKENNNNSLPYFASKTTRHLNHTPSSRCIWSLSFMSGSIHPSVCAFDTVFWFLSENVPPGRRPVDNWCLYSVYSMCAWFRHWLFVAFCSAVWRGWQVFELDISFRTEWWCRVICGRR